MFLMSALPKIFVSLMVGLDFCHFVISSGSSKSSIKPGAGSYLKDHGLGMKSNPEEISFVRISGSTSGRSGAPKLPNDVSGDSGMQAGVKTRMKRFAVFTNPKLMAAASVGSNGQGVDRINDGNSDRRSDFFSRLSNSVERDPWNSGDFLVKRKSNFISAGPLEDIADDEVYSRERRRLGDWRVKRRNWVNNHLRIWGKRFVDQLYADSQLAGNAVDTGLRKRRWDNLPLRVWG